MTKEMPKFVKSNKPAPAASKRSKKSFCVSKVDRSTSGKKILIYGKTGMGKSTLAAMAPGAVFIQPDNGLEDLQHPVEGGEFDVIPGVTSFEDVRDAVNTHSLFDNFDTIVLDTLTYVQEMCAAYVVQYIKKEKGGKAKSITDFGWAKGYEHVYNQMNLLKVDLDELVRSGKNVILIAQLAKLVVTDPSHGEYWFSQPDLFDKKNAPVTASFNAWASHIFKIDWAQVEIEEGKIGVASDQRAVYVKPELSFEAKTRGSTFDDYPVVTFDSRSDDSIWRILFDGTETDG